MKKTFVLLLLCCPAFGFANAPILEETKDAPAIPSLAAFSVREPVFLLDEPNPNCTCPRLPVLEELSPCEEDECAFQEEEPSDVEEALQEEIADLDLAIETDVEEFNDQTESEIVELKEVLPAEIEEETSLENEVATPKSLECDAPACFDIQAKRAEKKSNDLKSQKSNCLTWRRFSTSFGAEKVYLRFPRSPAVTQTADTYTAYTTEWGVTYSLTAYYPPISHIDPHAWFNNILASKQLYPFSIVAESIYQESADIWVMDYIVHDCIKDLIIKHRTVVTPFNGYTIQCVKPYGASDEFDYFVDNFFIRMD